MSYRIEKFSSTLKSVLSNIFLNAFNDPELTILSVSHVEVSKDLKSAKIFVSSYEIGSDRLIEKLEKAKGFIKRELSKNMRMKYIPEITFQFDTSFDFNQNASTKMRDEI
jgi:ribosome-binding factor A